MDTQTKIIHERFTYIICALFCVLVVGTVGFWFFGHGTYSFVDALYMTVITVSTIGFAEVIDLSNNPSGRMFTIFIAISGIATLSYLLTNFTAFIVEGELHNSFGRKRMKKRAATLSDHYIVCGMGNVGRHILVEMTATGHSFCAIDTNPAREELIDSSLLQNAFIVGDAMENSTLEMAGIMRAKGLFVATGDDHWNLIVSLSARQLNPKLTIVSECVDLKNREKIIQAGANRVVSTSKISGLRMASEMVRPTVVSFLDKMLRDPQKGLRIEEVEVQNETLTKVGDLKLEAIQDILLLAVESRAGMRFNPPPESPLQGGDRLIVMATAEARNALATLLMCG